VTVGKIILNFLITGETFGEIVLSGLGASMKTLSIMAILNGDWTVDSNMHRILTVVILDYRIKCGEVHFGVLACNVTFSTFIVGVHLVC